MNRYALPKSQASDCVDKPISERGGNSRFPVEETREDTERGSEPEELSKSLENLKGDEVILADGRGKKESWGEEKRGRQKKSWRTREKRGSIRNYLI